MTPGPLEIDSILGTDLGDRDVWARAIVKAKKRLKRKAPAAIELENAIRNISITDTMKGSSTIVLEVDDEDWELVDGGFFDADRNGKLDTIDVNYPDRSRFWWRLTQVGVDGTRGGASLSLTFMERAACHLMLHHGPLKVKRSKKTRAEFLKMLSDQVGRTGEGKQRKNQPNVLPIKFHSKELHDEQPIAGEGGVAGGAVRGSIFAVGDSLAVGTDPFLQSLVKNKINSDSQTGRSSTQGLDILQARDNLPKTLLVQLGTNDTNVATFRNQVQAAKGLDGVDRIYWVNIARPVLGGVTDAELNAVLRDEANDKLRVINWKGLVASGGVTLGDGIHASPDGYEKRAKLIRSALGSPSEPKTPAKKSDSQREEEKDAGINKGANLKIKGVKASASQLSHVERSLDATANLDAPELAYIAMLCSGIGESAFSAVVNSLGYGGVFQGQVETGGRYFKVDDTEAQARCFMLGGKGFNEGAISMVKRGVKDPGQIATDVEVSGMPGSFYGVYRPEAEALLEAYGGAGSLGSGSASGGRTYNKAYHFTVGGPNNPRETYWDAANRMAEEVKWCYFLDGQHAYYDDEMRLIMQKPAAIVRRNGPAVVTFQANWDARAMATEAELELICDPFEFRAGQVLQLEGFGPASTGSTAKPVGLPGRWLIEETTRERFSLATRFSLKQPIEPAPEPAPETGARKARGRPGGGTGEIAQLRPGMSPKQVIDEIVLPMSNRLGVPRTVAQNDQSNASHGPTISGGRSDHQGPPSVRWAADMSNGSSPTKEMDALCKALWEAFDMPPLSLSTTGSAGSTQTSSATHDGFRFQLIYRSRTGGNHDNHNHFGVAVA